MGRGDAAAGAGVGAAPGLRGCPQGAGWVRQPHSRPLCAGPCASSPVVGCLEQKREAKLPGMAWTTRSLQHRRWGCGHRGTLAEGWHGSPRLPVPFPLRASAWGDAASAWHVCGEGRTSWAGTGSAVQLSQLLLRQVLMLADGDSTGFLYRQLPFLASLERKDGKATAYLCSNFACSLPITSPQELRGMLCS